MSIQELMESVELYAAKKAKGTYDVTPALDIADALTDPSPITRDDCKGWRASIDNNNFTTNINGVAVTITFWNNEPEAFIGSAPANPPLETKGDLWQAVLRLNRKDK